MLTFKLKNPIIFQLFVKRLKTNIHNMRFVSTVLVCSSLIGVALSCYPGGYPPQFQPVPFYIPKDQVQTIRHPSVPGGGFGGGGFGGFGGGGFGGGGAGGSW